MLSSLYGSSRNIDNVFMDGRFLKRDGQLTTIDIAETLNVAQERVIYIIDKFFKEHPEQKKKMGKQSALSDIITLWTSTQLLFQTFITSIRVREC